jgi:UDP:flavonoid glycosyltransferase YjiC (YdhE family)
VRVLFCSLDTLGLLYPAVGLAKALHARRHEVAFVANLNLEPTLSDLGLRRIPRSSQRDGQSFVINHWANPVLAALQVKHIEHALECFQPDVLIGQPLTLGPFLVAERQKIPLAIMGFLPYLWPYSDELAQSAARTEVDDWRIWRHGEMIRFLNEARALFHLPSYRGDCRETPFLGDLFLLRSVPDLEPDHRRLPERVRLVGSCLWEPEKVDEELERWLSDAESANAPLVYVQHGQFCNFPSFWSGLVGLLGNTEYRVAASMGRFDGAIGAVPKNFLVRPHIPQQRILSRAQVVVASANTTVALGALEAGVPSVLIPGGAEQPDVAELCRRAGVSKTLLPDEATTENICSAIASILTERRYRERAAYFQHKFSLAAGFEGAADLIEHLVTRRRPLLRTEAKASEHVACTFL